MNSIDVFENEDFDFKKENRKTVPILTKYEKAKIIGFRASQIDNGSTPLVVIKTNDTSINIAEREFESKLLPLIIARKLPNNTIEYWHVNELN